MSLFSPAWGKLQFARAFKPVEAEASCKLKLALLLLVCLPASAAEPDVPAMKARSVKIKVASEIRGPNGETGVARSQGSGYLVGNGKYVVTNNHVCCRTSRGALSIVRTVMMVHYSKDEKTPAKVVWSSEQKDLAVLELEQPMARPPVVFAPNDQVKDGMRVWAVGFPGAAENETTTEDSDFVPTTTNGIIGKFVHQLMMQNGPVIDTISHSAATNSGNSGGPLFNLCGQVVGTNYAKALTTIRQRVRVRDAAGNEVEKEIEQRVVAADGINWSIRNSELLPELDRLNVKYDLAREACTEVDKETKKELSEVSGRMSTLMIAQVGSIALALVAVGLAMNKRVRETVSRRLTTHRRSEPDLRKIQGHASPVFVASRPYLKGISGYYSGASIQLEEQPWVLGRDRDASNLVFPPDSGSISKRHCTIHYDSATGKVFLEDAWSSNGTFLASGVKLEPGRPYELRPGDKFYLADKNCLFEITAEG
jgi:hypothetical protein